MTNVRKLKKKIKIKVIYLLNEIKRKKEAFYGWGKCGCMYVLDMRMVQSFFLCFFFVMSW